jgi:uroporphyrin-III C-methyltransferase/precorrin-2 dehydrogenase/sirohydrochlorin ferrochelatase
VSGSSSTWPNRERPSEGFVSLVGAGPGDPELLTLKAARALAEADIVFYDALVAPEMLALAPRAQRFSVGKRCGRAAIRQETIHWLLIRAARRGKRVVRLKGGDPFVFGRGGEEALALARAGVPFEVVPGVSNAVAAPALAGIPVTHRGIASAFVVVSGHAESAFRPVLSALEPGVATIVVLMGLHARAALADLLLARGFAGSTPAAILFGASTTAAHAWRGDLKELRQVEIPEAALGLPGTIVVGEVVSLADVIAATASSPAEARGPERQEERRHARG